MNKELEEEFNAFQKLMSLEKVRYYVPKTDEKKKTPEQTARPPYIEKIK